MLRLCQRRGRRFERSNRQFGLAGLRWCQKDHQLDLAIRLGRNPRLVPCRQWLLARHQFDLAGHLRRLSDRQPRRANQGQRLHLQVQLGWRRRWLEHYRQPLERHQQQLVRHRQRLGQLGLRQCWRRQHLVRLVQRQRQLVRHRQRRRRRQRRHRRLTGRLRLRWQLVRQCHGLGWRVLRHGQDRLGLRRCLRVLQRARPIGQGRLAVLRRRFARLQNRQR